MSYKKPLLSTFEFFTLTKGIPLPSESYPMDYYSDKGGIWTNYYHNSRDQRNRPSKNLQKKDKIQLEVETKPTYEVKNDETVDF
jgi:hypothetical protein